MSGALTRRGFGRAGMVALGALGVPSLLAACGDDSSGSAGPVAAASSTPRRGGTLRAAYASSPADTLDIIHGRDVLGSVRGLAVYERLGDAHPDGSVTPRLYESLTPNADGSRWTLKLKPNITFSDGKPLTTSDVLASFAAFTGTESGASIAMFDAKASRATDARTATIALTSPVYDLPARVSGVVLVIMPGGKPATKLGDVVGSGPYRIESFTPGQRTVLTRRTDYWDGDARGHLDRIELVAAADAKARLSALRSGQVEWADDVAYLDASTLRADKAISIHRSGAQQGLAWFLNMFAPPFDDEKVRQALKYAVDRQKIVDTALYGFGSIGNDLWGRGLPNYNSALAQRTHDPDKARALLREAGRPQVKAELLTSPIGPGLVEATQLLAEQARAVGFDITVRTISPDVYFSQPEQWARASGVAFAQVGAFTDMAPLIYLSDGPYNFGWKRPAWDTAYNKAVGDQDATARRTAFDDLQKQLYDAGPDLVWGFAPRLVATAPSVGGVDANPNYGVADLSFVHRTG
ncbi:ABC transporter substrate-binding protein [Frankia sp. Ag45/Mut15]|uniref:ABC transporter substrate-binding protein n=1 Tax=Frankia umida TaxID=573489 RepID=A0ABT0JRU0_9ACTN|nr:ABC transporter substrate-binding protein [Frankia umida]MCK9874252.1 ABC transporter substrate-binding protein [Frankia umida]